MGPSHSPYLSGGLLTLDKLRTILELSVTREKMLPLETFELLFDKIIILRELFV
jgi:hypothetical protein